MRRDAVDEVALGGLRGHQKVKFLDRRGAAGGGGEGDGDRKELRLLAWSKNLNCPHGGLIQPLQVGSDPPQLRELFTGVEGGVRRRRAHCGGGGGEQEEPNKGGNDWGGPAAAARGHGVGILVAPSSSSCVWSCPYTWTWARLSSSSSSCCCCCYEIAMWARNIKTSPFRCPWLP